MISDAERSCTKFLQMKICFFGNISGALQGRTQGGAELQIALLAKALALKGHEVVIIDGASDSSFINEEGIKLINMPGWNKGIRGLRLFTKRIPALWRIFVDQKADFYYVRMRAYLNIIPYLAAKKNKSKFIVAVASDIDVFSFGKKFKFAYKKDFNLFRLFTVYIPNDMIFKFLLKKADYILLQHSGQGIGLRKCKGRQVIFQNIIEPNKINSAEPIPQNYFIYVGAVTMLKGADSLLDLINIVDESVLFMIVGQPDGKVPNKLYEKLKGKRNVMLKGQMDHRKTLALVSRAKALINTSYYEGFSNVFLEAWAKGIPVISLNVNPENILEKYELGICCNGDLLKMKKIIESGEMDAFDKYKMVSYVSKFHSFETAGDRFLKCIK